MSLHCEFRFRCVRPKLKKNGWRKLRRAFVCGCQTPEHFLGRTRSKLVNTLLLFFYSLTWNQSGRPWLRLDLQASDQAERLNYNNLLLVSCLLTTGSSYLAVVHWTSTWLRSTQHKAFGNLRVTRVLNRDVSWRTCHVVSVSVLQTPDAPRASVQWILYKRPRRHTTWSQNVWH